jgi:hypothetical protein
VVGSAHAQNPAAKTELQGAWFGEWSQVSGGPPVRLTLGSVSLHFSGDQIIATGLLPAWFQAGPRAPTPRTFVLLFFLNTQAAPKQIDYWQLWENDIPPVRKQKPFRFLAVYEVIGDQFRLAVPTCDDGGPFPNLTGKDSGRRPALVTADQPCANLLMLKRH